MRNLVGIGTGVLLAYYFGKQVGYSVYGVNNDTQAMFYGGLTAWLFGTIPGYAFVYPALRSLFNNIMTGASAPKKKLNTENNKLAVKSIEDINDIFDKKSSPLTYYGMMDRDVHYEERGTSTSGPQNSKVRVRMSYQLVRNLAAMRPDEQEACRFLYALEFMNMIAPERIDDLKLGMLWGDGRCKVTGMPPKLPWGAVKANDFKSVVDIVRYEARLRMASVDAAITEIYNLLDQARQRSSDPALVELHDRMNSQGGWGRGVGIAR